MSLAGGRTREGAGVCSVARRSSAGKARSAYSRERVATAVAALVAAIDRVDEWLEAHGDDCEPNELVALVDAQCRAMSALLAIESEIERRALARLTRELRDVERRAATPAPSPRPDAGQPDDATAPSPEPRAVDTTRAPARAPSGRERARPIATRCDRVGERLRRAHPRRRHVKRVAPRSRVRCLSGVRPLSVRCADRSRVRCQSRRATRPRSRRTQAGAGDPSFERAPPLRRLTAPDSRPLLTWPNLACDDHRYARGTVSRTFAAIIGRNASPQRERDEVRARASKRTPSGATRTRD